MSLRSKFTSLLILLFCFSALQAQEFIIKGKLLDKQMTTPLDAATVYVETVKDSTLIAYSITDGKGGFIIEGKTAEKTLVFYATFNGYQSLRKEITTKSQIDLGTLALEVQVELLGEVMIAAERVPITVKKDTLEFNASSFKTRPDATVEEVLRKLPGVAIDANGTITVNGQQVDQVLVNGQVFFSKDPKVATKSLPKDIIDKIQITNTKTKTEERTGDDAQSENKTINLTIREDKNKGYLARMSGGYGTDKRYQANGLINYFNNNKRVSVLASSNNINNAGFSYDEVFDMLGGGGSTRRGFGGGGFDVGGINFGFGQGISTSSTLGASFADAEKGKYEVEGNHFFSYSDSYNDEASFRENILPDRRFFTERTSRFKGTNQNNKGSADLEFNLNKNLIISFEPNINVGNTTTNNDQNTLSKDALGALINSNRVKTANRSDLRSFSNQFSLFQKLDTIGGYVSLDFDVSQNKNESLTSLNSLRKIYANNEVEETVLDQEKISDNLTNAYHLDFEYRKALSKDIFFQAGMEYDVSTRENKLSVYDYDLASAAYANFNNVQSSDFTFKTIQRTPSIGLRNNSEKWRLRLSASYTDVTLNNEDFLQNLDFSKSYSKLLLNLYSRYSLGKNKSLSLRYSNNLDLPNITQLQPVPNLNNPLNIVIGNPDLDPALNHSVGLNYNNYNWRERSGIFVYAGATFTDNRVSAVTTTDESFLRNTTFTNVNGNYNGYFGVGYSKQIKKDSLYMMNLNIRPNANFFKNVGFSNGELLKTTSYSLSPSVSTSINFNEKFQIEPGYSLGYSRSTYNLKNIPEVSILNHNATLKTTTFWPENLVWGNDVTYSYNPNVGPGFDKNAFFWNMSIGVQMFKDTATLKLLAYDILNQNINTRRTTAEDYIEDFQGTVLQQYFMLSFSLKVDKFGGQKPGDNSVRMYR
jgi:hypothetical protein